MSFQSSKCTCLQLSAFLENCRKSIRAMFKLPQHEISSCCCRSDRNQSRFRLLLCRIENISKQRRSAWSQSSKAKPSTLPRFQNSERISMLTSIKLLHTVIWAFLAASILALPVVGVLRRFRGAAILSVIVLLEYGLLAVNGGRCPLTDIAA